jgi:hypothetical protein
MRLVRNVSALLFLAVAFLLPPIGAHPWESVCSNTETACYAKKVDFLNCSIGCSESNDKCQAWCREFGTYPYSWECQGEPSAGHCYCAGECEAR